MVHIDLAFVSNVDQLGLAGSGGDTNQGRLLAGTGIIHNHPLRNHSWLGLSEIG
jgi:hypothetical protein